MSKYGTKHTCWSCGTKFYDLGKSEAKCPKCGSDPTAAPADVGGSSVVDDDEDDYDLDDFKAGEEEE